LKLIETQQYDVNIVVPNVFYFQYFEDFVLDNGWFCFGTTVRH